MNGSNGEHIDSGARLEVQKRAADYLAGHASRRTRPARHAHRSALALAVARLADQADDDAPRRSRWATAGILFGGGAVSLLAGMTVGGAFASVEVALPPAGHAPAGPKIEYAAPADGTHANRSPAASHPAQSHAAPSSPAPGATPTTVASSPSAASSGSATPTTTPAGSPPPSSGSGSSSGGSGSGSGSTTPSTTVPPAPAPSPPPPSGPLSGVRRVLG